LEVCELLIALPVVVKQHENAAAQTHCGESILQRASVVDNGLVAASTRAGREDSFGKFVMLPERFERLEIVAPLHHENYLPRAPECFEEARAFYPKAIPDDEDLGLVEPGGHGNSLVAVNEEDLVRLELLHHEFGMRCHDCLFLLSGCIADHGCESLLRCGVNVVLWFLDEQQAVRPREVNG